MASTFLTPRRAVLGAAGVAAYSGAAYWSVTQRIMRAEIRLYSETVAMAGGGTRVLVTNSIDHTVSVIDTITNTVIATIPVGTAPNQLAVTPGGTRAYVANQGSNTVSVINTATNAVITTVPVGTGPIGVAVTLGGTRAYVTDSGSDTVSVINTATNAVEATLTVGNTPTEVAIANVP